MIIHKNRTDTESESTQSFDDIFAFLAWLTTKTQDVNTLKSFLNGEEMSDRHGNHYTISL